MPTEVIHRNYYESGSKIRNLNADSTNTGHCIMSHFYPAHIRPVRLKESLILTTEQISRLSKQQRPFFLLDTLVSQAKSTPIFTI